MAPNLRKRVKCITRSGSYLIRLLIVYNRRAVLTVWQLLDTATERVEQEGRIDGVVADRYGY
jgi:hypothetical protein